MKSRATENREVHQGVFSALMDKFDGLPNEIVHRILSLLAFEDLTRAGILNKRFRQLYLSVPSLDLQTLPDDFRERELHHEWMSSVHRYFCHRGNSKMQFLAINWIFPSNSREEQFQMMTWLQKAVCCNVEVLELSFQPYDKRETNFALPSCLYLSPCLRSLSVISNYHSLEAPSPSLLCNIHFLRLGSVKLGDPDKFFQWISCSCKCLKELQLFYVTATENIAVTSSSLETFRYCSFGTTNHLSISGENLKKITLYRSTDLDLRCSSLSICAPKLKRVRWRGALVDHSYSSEDSITLRAGFNNSCKVLSLFTVDEMSTVEKTLQDTPLDDVLHLVLIVRSLNDLSAPTMMSLLRRMPNLQTLYLTSLSIDTKPIENGFWKMQNLAFVDRQLRSVTMKSLGHLLGSNEIEFARHILEHAENLKKLRIYTKRGVQHNAAAADLLTKANKISTVDLIIR